MFCTHLVLPLGRLIKFNNIVNAGFQHGFFLFNYRIPKSIENLNSLCTRHLECNMVDRRLESDE